MSDDARFPDFAGGFDIFGSVAIVEADAALSKIIALVNYAERRVRLFGDLYDAADALTVAARLLRCAAGSPAPRDHPGGDSA